MSANKIKKNNRTWLSPCALFCDKCTIHLRTPEELAYWRDQNIDLDKIKCDGCRSPLNGNHWSPECSILLCCVYDKHLSYCSQCNEFPCSKLVKWSKEYEHHEKALQRLQEMKEMGIEKWLPNHGYE